MAGKMSRQHYRWRFCEAHVAILIITRTPTFSISVANAGASTVRRTLWRAEQHRVLVWRTNLQPRAAGRNISEINVGLKVIIIL